MEKRKNYLDFVPVLNAQNSWDEKDGIVTVHMVHKGIHHVIAQKLFRSPRVSHIALDTFGSFVWKKIDGVRTVGDIADEMKAHFGDQAEPVYNRLVHYMKILQNNRFVQFQKKR